MMKKIKTYKGIHFDGSAYHVGLFKGVSSQYQSTGLLREIDDNLEILKSDYSVFPVTFYSGNPLENRFKGHLYLHLLLSIDINLLIFNVAGDMGWIDEDTKNIPHDAGWYLYDTNSGPTSCNLAQYNHANKTIDVRIAFIGGCTVKYRIKVSDLAFWIQTGGDIDSLGSKVGIIEQITELFDVGGFFRVLG